MANFQWGFAGQAFTIQWLAPFQTTGLFPQARIIDSSGNLVSGGPFNLSANATIAYLYENTGWTPGTEQQYTIVIDVYTDAGRTTLHESFDSTTIDVRVKDIAASMRGGSLGGTNKLDRGDIALLIDRISEEVWKKKFPTGDTAQETLIGKSVFNPKRDKVKADIKIPKVDLSSVEDRIDERSREVMSSMKVIQPEQINKVIMKETARLSVVIGEVQSKLLAKTGILQNDLHKVGEVLVDLENSTAREDLGEYIKNLQKTCADLQVKLTGIKKDLPEELSVLRTDLRSSVETLQKELQTNEQMMEVMNSRQAERFNKMLASLQAALNKILLSNQISLVNSAKYSQINE